MRPLSNSEFQPGSAVVFADEIYFVEKNFGISGRVSDLNGCQVIEPFYWLFDGEMSRLATADELESLPSTPLAQAALAMLKARGMGMPENLKAELAKITQQPQRQDAALDQLKDLQAFASKLGLYGAADLIRLMVEKRMPNYADERDAC